MLATYDRPLELVFSLVFVLFEAALAVTIRPAFDLVAAAARRGKDRWSGQPPKPGSTAALLSASKEAVQSEEDRAREVVKEARVVYDEIERLQREPRPLARTGSNDDPQRRQADDRLNAVAGPSSKPLIVKLRKRSDPVPTVFPGKRAASAQPPSSSMRPVKFGGSLPGPPTLGETRSSMADLPRLPRPGLAVASSRRNVTARQASKLGGSSATVGRPLPSRPLSPPPARVSTDDFLLPLDRLPPSPIHLPLPVAGVSSSGLRLRNLASPAAAAPDRPTSLALCPPLSPSPLDDDQDAAIKRLPAAGSPLPLFIADDLPSKAPAPGSLPNHADLEPTIADSPARKVFEDQRRPRSSLPATPAPPGSFFRPIRSTARSVLAPLEPGNDGGGGCGGGGGGGGGNHLDDSALTSLRSAPALEEAPAPAPTPTRRRARQPSTPATRATPARRAKQKPQAQPARPPSPSVSPAAPPSSGKRRKVSDRWAYVPVVEVDELDPLDHPTEGRRRIQSKTAVVEVEVGTDPEGSSTVPVDPTLDARAAVEASQGGPVRRGRSGAPSKTAPAPLRRRQVAVLGPTSKGSSSDARVAVRTRTAAARSTTGSGSKAPPVPAGRSQTTTRAAAASSARLTDSTRPSTRPTATMAAGAKPSALAGGPVRVRRAAAAEGLSVGAGPMGVSNEDGAEG